MWIMIVKPPCTDPAPIKMAMYWALPWPNVEHARDQAEKLAEIEYWRQYGRIPRKVDKRILCEKTGCPFCGASLGELCRTSGGESIPTPHKAREDAWVPQDDDLIDLEVTHVPGVMGVEPNWNGAVRVCVAGVDIRVFPHEISKPSSENMHLYVLGDGTEESTHELVAGSAAEEKLLEEVLKGEARFVYDAALVDGCTQAQAMQTALGNEIETPDADFPPIGWYRPKWWVLETFCRESELESIESKHGKW